MYSYQMTLMMHQANQVIQYISIIRNLVIRILQLPLNSYPDLYSHHSKDQIHLTQNLILTNLDLSKYLKSLRTWN